MSREEEFRNFDPASTRVLVVDSNPVCLKYFLFVLKKCGYKVVMGVADANQALATLRSERNRFDLVVTSLVVGSMNGFELLDAINLEFDLPVIIASADDRPRSVMKALEHGAADYLLKPIRVQQIQVLWQHLIRRKMKRRNLMINSNINGETESHGDVQLDNNLVEAGMEEEDDESGSADSTDPGSAEPTDSGLTDPADSASSCC